MRAPLLSQPLQHHTPILCSHEMKRDHAKQHRRTTKRTSETINRSRVVARRSEVMKADMDTGDYIARAAWHPWMALSPQISTLCVRVHDGSKPELRDNHPCERERRNGYPASCAHEGDRGRQQMRDRPGALRRETMRDHNLTLHTF